MNPKAIVIASYRRNHSIEETAKLIERLFCRDTPKDDHGHWYLEEIM